MTYSPGVALWSILDTYLGRNVYVISTIVRDYPMLAYLGFNIPNHFKESILSESLKYEDAKTINFKAIGQIKPTMSSDGKAISWYEVSTFANVQKISATTASTSIVLVDVKGMAVWDVVITIPAVWSVGTRSQVKITAINVGTKTLTVDAAVNSIVGDSLQVLYSVFTFNTKLTRTVADDSAIPVTTYFQKFGWYVIYDIQDLNTVYLLKDWEQNIKIKFAQSINQAINQFAYTWYTGRNISGANAETDGIERVIAEKVANGESTAVVAITGTDIQKVAAIIAMLTDAAKAAVYTGNEQPTSVINTSMQGAMAGLLQSNVIYQNFIESSIEWGLKVFTSPFFKNINFLVDKTLDQLYPVTNVGYVFPKHLVSFMSPMYDVPDAAWIVKKYTNNGFKMIKQAVTNGDSVEFTFEQWIANIFAGQTIPGTYKKFTM